MAFTPEFAGTPINRRAKPATPSTTATATLISTGTATPTLTSTATPPPCVGDCNGNGQVTVDEILAAVNNALNGC